MDNTNFNDEIALLMRANPAIDLYSVGMLLTAGHLYRRAPEISVFRELYAHMDPLMIDDGHDKLTFLKIAHSKDPTSVVKERLNSYLNIKFNDMVHSKAYKENMQTFKHYSLIASSIMDDILKVAAFPPEIVATFAEPEEVRRCYDFYEMLKLYRKAEDYRLKFEILRKLGLIVLLARIDRSVPVAELDDRMLEVWRAFRKRLGFANKRKVKYFFWLNAENKVRFANRQAEARSFYDSDLKERHRLAMQAYPMQSLECNPFRTNKGNEIIHMEIRNKFRKDGRLCYTSFVEKMLRKNLEFPNQVRDVIALKIVVNTENEIEHIVDDLESFLGGTSTRKKEKNTYHKFGRRSLSKYSGKNYSVWKAIYDITLPHMSIPRIEKMLELTKGNKDAQEDLKKRYEYLVDNPRDFVIEVQLQDLKSHLQSLAYGSSTSHDTLKRNQIRVSSFFKLFPKEIYRQSIKQLKLETLQKTYSGQNTARLVPLYGAGAEN